MLEDVEEGLEVPGDAALALEVGRPLQEAPGVHQDISPSGRRTGLPVNQVVTSAPGGGEDARAGRARGTGGSGDADDDDGGD